MKLFTILSAISFVLCISTIVCWLLVRNLQHSAAYTGPVPPPIDRQRGWFLLVAVILAILPVTWAQMFMRGCMEKNDL
jgi:hypothetical protein